MTEAGETNEKGPPDRFSRNSLIVCLDDTDSGDGMCTTYLTVLLTEELRPFGRVSGCPFLIRLNPTIPHKTRGNAALGFLFDMDGPPAAFSDGAADGAGTADVWEEIVSRVCRLIDGYARTDCEKTNPGAVFIPSSLFGAVRKDLGGHFRKAVTDIVPMEEAVRLIRRHGIPHYRLKNGRGLIGALAAAGAILNPGWETTYEYLAYRRPENWGTKRQVSSESLFRADRETYPDTWDTVDYSGKKKPYPVCVPGSPDPVLYGVRGKSPEAVRKAASFIESEPIDRACVFQTNQGTDAHLLPAVSFSDMAAGRSYRVSGVVAAGVRTIEGGHDIFRIRDRAGAVLFCAAYEPTGCFRKIVRQLIPGDEVTVSGSLKENGRAEKTLNLEKIRIEKTAPAVRYENPACPVCGRKMASAGAGQGFRCRACRTDSKEKCEKKEDRSHLRGFYEVPPAARRHLSKPLIREKDAAPGRRTDAKDAADIPLYPSR